MTELELREWCKQYVDCFIPLKGPLFGDKWQTCYIASAVNDGSAGIISIIMPTRYDKYEVRLFYKDNTNKMAVEPDTALPKVGFFNVHDVAYYYERNPTRQWKRGLCRHNSWVVPPWFEYASSLNNHLHQTYLDNRQFECCGDSEPRIAHPYVGCLYNRTFVDFDTALVKLTAGHTPIIAVDEDTAISLDIESPHLLLWKGRMPVAEVRSKYEVVTKVPELRQEVVDFFNRARRYDVIVK